MVELQFHSSADLSAIDRGLGFSLVELIAVLLIVGILSVSLLTRAVPSDTMQLQSSRDSIVAAFQSAQQLALSRRHSVQLITGSNQVDIRLDVNGDSVFAADESVTFGGVTYPFPLANGQTLTPLVFNYNRLGQTSGASVALSQNGKVVSITVDSSGYAK